MVHGKSKIFNAHNNVYKNENVFWIKLPESINCTYKHTHLSYLYIYEYFNHKNLNYVFDNDLRLNICIKD